jgi:putative transposase
VRDATLVQFSVYAGLRAKELAHLLISDVYTESGVPREQQILKQREEIKRKTMLKRRLRHQTKNA